MQFKMKMNVLYITDTFNWYEAEKFRNVFMVDEVTNTNVQVVSKLFCLYFSWRIEINVIFFERND